MLAHWIWLATRTNITDRVKVELVRHFQDPEGVFFADSASYDQIEDLTPAGKESLADKDLGPAEKILRTCQKEGLRVLTYQDAAYPKRLKHIPDPPLVFYYKGTLPDFDDAPVIGVVGTRKASLYGMTAAKRLGYQIGKCGGILVSGMAAGIDAMAMAGALTAGATVVGILGCGAEQIYPKSNRALFADTERYGCILSEFPPETPPFGWNFPKRNRVISGLSNGVLIVEAPEKSGALITAGQALDQGRDVFVVPGNIDVPTCVGSNRLLREGAIAVSSGWDILSEYEAQYPDKIRRAAASAELRAYADEQEPREDRGAKVAQKRQMPEKKTPPKVKNDKKAIDNGAASPYSGLDNVLDGLSSEEQTLIRALGREERLVDDVIAETGLPTGKVLAMLTLLEVKRVIRRLPGKRITLRTGEE